MDLDKIQLILSKKVNSDTSNHISHFLGRQTIKSGGKKAYNKKSKRINTLKQKSKRINTLKNKSKKR